jgi:flavin-binding protein dodecin
MIILKKDEIAAGRVKPTPEGSRTLAWCRGHGGGSLGGMSNHIYKKIELVGSSSDSIEDAVKNALAKASQSLRNLRWFEVLETRGHIEDGKIGHWQVTIKVGFTLDG